MFGKLLTLMFGLVDGFGIDNGSMSQISWQYSRMVRSEENYPDMAIPWIAISFHFFWSL